MRRQTPTPKPCRLPLEGAPTGAAVLGELVRQLNDMTSREKQLNELCNRVAVASMVEAQPSNVRLNKPATIAVACLVDDRPSDGCLFASVE